MIGELDTPVMEVLFGIVMKAVSGPGLDRFEHTPEGSEKDMIIGVDF